MDASLRLLRYAKKDATTADEKSVDSLPHLSLKLVATTMLIMNQNTIVDTFALKGKKTKSAFSNNTLVIQRIEARNRYDLWRFQVHNDERPDAIENFLKRIKAVTTFLAVEGSQFLPIETNSDSTVYNSESFPHNNESYSCDNEFKVPESASLNWSMKLPIQNQSDSDSTMDSISLLRSLRIEDGPQFRASHTNHTKVLLPIEKNLRTNYDVIQPQNQEGSFGAISYKMSYPFGGSGPVDSPYQQMITPMIEDGSFDTINTNIPSRNSSTSSTGQFKLNSNFLPCSVGGEIQLNQNTETMTTQFGERIPFNTVNGSMKQQTRETQFNDVYRGIPITGRRPFNNATDGDFSSPIPNKRQLVSENNGAVFRHSIDGGMYLLPRKLEESFKMPHQFGDRKFSSNSVGEIIPTRSNHEPIIPTQFKDKSLFPATNVNSSRSMMENKENSSKLSSVSPCTFGENRPLKDNTGVMSSHFQAGQTHRPAIANQSMAVFTATNPSKANNSTSASCPVRVKQPYKLHNLPNQGRQLFSATNNISPQSITGERFCHGNVLPSVIEKGRATNGNIPRSFSERQVLKATNENLPPPFEEKLPMHHSALSNIIGEREQFHTTGVGLLPPAQGIGNNILKPSRVIEEVKQINATKVHLQSIESGSTHWNFASSITADRPILADGVGPDKSSDGVTLMNVDAEQQNDGMSLEDDSATQSSPSIQTFSLKSVDAQACIAEPLRLGPLLIRKVLDQIPETSLTVLTDPNYDGHFKAVELALEAGTDISGNSEREIMKAFVRSGAFLPFIEGIKSLLNNGE